MMRTTLKVMTIALLSPLVWSFPFPASAQEATPAAVYRCEAISPSSPVAGKPAPSGTPLAGMRHGAMEMDGMYIDMMIPHHQSIIAMAQAALPRLTHDRLRQIARDVIATQGPEITELQRYRETFYGSPKPTPMDEAMLTGMAQMMPGMSGTLSDMARQMDPAAQVAAFCAAENPDLAFIDQTIPHHQMAIESSQIVLEEAVHPEIRDIARRVIAAQQREIDELHAIRQQITGAATPAGS